VHYTAWPDISSGCHSLILIDGDTIYEDAASAAAVLLVESRSVAAISGSVSGGLCLDHGQTGSYRFIRWISTEKRPSRRTSSGGRPLGITIAKPTYEYRSPVLALQSVLGSQISEWSDSAVRGRNEFLTYTYCRYFHPGLRRSPIGLEVIA